MKENELMIGDLAMLNYEGVRKIVRIIRLHQNLADVMTENGSEIDRVAYSVLEPIFLTEEILKANGFFRLGTSQVLLWKSGLNFVLKNPSVPSEYHDNYWLDISGIGIQINFVNELQHSLRLCGIYELADNFVTNDRL